MREFHHKNLTVLVVDTARIKTENLYLDRFLKATIEVFSGFLGHKDLLTSKKQVVEFSLTLCGVEKIKKLNMDYRSKKKETDVLSFPINDSLRKGAEVPFLAPALHLGDIFICKEMAKKQGGVFDLPYEAELAHLLVHGLLHLLGFDHEVSSDEEKIMEVHELNLVKKIYKKMGI